MKFQEANLGSKTEFAEYVKTVIPKLFKGELAVEGKKVALPQDGDLDFKVKYDEDESGGSFTIKVSWEYPGARDEDVDVDTD